MLLSEIEDALIAKIKELLGDKVKTVESLPADWDADTLKRVLILAPGVFVVFGGGPASPGGGNQTPVISAGWSVLVVTGHASGELARRRGDRHQVGAYELLQVLIPALHGFKPAGTSALLLERTDNLFTGELDRKGVAVYAATFRQRLQFPVEIPDAALAPFVTFHGEIDTAPADGAPEIVSHLTLPQ